MSFAGGLVPVRSSSLAAVGYDPVSARLRVEFRDGTTYDYFAVPYAVHDGLMNAPSIGGYFGARIRPVYPSKRVA